MKPAILFFALLLLICTACRRTEPASADLAAGQNAKQAQGDLDSVIAYYNRGNAKHDKGDLDGAIADYTKAIELKADFAEAYTNRGGVKQAKGDLDGAIADFTKAIELKPDYADAYNTRGVAKQAEDLINAAIRGDAAAVQALLAKGAEVNAKGNDGWTALILASQEGHLHVVQALLAKGADVNAKADNGATALMVAKDVEVRASLEQAGAKPAAVVPEPADRGPGLRFDIAANCSASYTIDLTVELSPELTNNQQNILIELRQGAVGNSKVVDTKQFAGHTGTVVFSGLCDGSYFIDIGNGSTVAVGPVHVLRNNEDIHSTIQVTFSEGNIGTMNRSQL